MSQMIMKMHVKNIHAASATHEKVTSLSSDVWALAGGQMLTIGWLRVTFAAQALQCGSTAHPPHSPPHGYESSAFAFAIGELATMHRTPQTSVITTDARATSASAGHRLFFLLDVDWSSITM